MKTPNNLFNALKVWIIIFLVLVSGIVIVNADYLNKINKEPLGTGKFQANKGCPLEERESEKERDTKCFSSDDEDSDEEWAEILGKSFSRENASENEILRAKNELQELEMTLIEEEENNRYEDPYSFDLDTNDWYTRDPSNTNMGNESHSNDKETTGCDLKGTRSLKRKRQKIDERIILAEMKKKCCQQNCIQAIHPNVVMSSRTKFMSKSQEEQRSYILNAFDHMEYEKRGGREASNKRHRVSGKKVCYKAWCTTYGISETRYFDLLAKFRQGESDVARKPRTSISYAYELAKVWFIRFSKVGDRMPHNNKINLPSCLTKSTVYNMYKTQMEGKPTLGRSQFIYGMWKKDFGHVFIPKQSRFTKCTVCEHLKKKLQNAYLEEDDRKRFALMRSLHLEQQMAERESYYKHGAKALLSPEKYLSLIIDGMDQGKHNIPHFKVTTKEDQCASRVKTHVTGVLVNMRSSAYTFIDTCQWPHDSNLTINVLLRILVDVQTKNGFLPPTLYLQMDNCYRECKNKYILTFLSILVEKGIFDKIKLSFLMVGHTHEDVDQMFSCISRQLLRNDAHTIPSLASQIQQSYSPTPNVKKLTEMFDVKGWLMGHFEEKISGHVYPHQFKIVRNERGKACLFYRLWSTSSLWKPKKGIILVKDPPTSKPAQVLPDFSKMNLNKLENDLSKYRLNFSEDDMKWWKVFVEETRNSKQQNAAFYLDKLKKCKKPVVKRRVLTEEEKKQNEELEKLTRKETEDVEIVVGRPKTKKRKQKTGKENTQSRKRQRKT